MFVALLGAQVNLEIPFEHPFPEIPLVLVDVGINQSAPLRAVIDTGQGIAPVLLTPAVARKLNLSWTENTRYESSFAVGGGFPPVVYKTKIQELRLGRQAFRVEEAGVTASLEPIAAQLQQPLVANIGYGFFKDYTLELNYRARRMKLSGTRLGGGTPFVLGAKKPLAIVEGRLNGQGPFRFAIDSGASSTAISRYLAERLMMPRGMTVPMMGGSGQTVSYMTSAESLEVAGRRFTNLTMATGDFFGPLAQAVGSPVDGILGANAFVNLTLTIDYPGRHVAISNPQ